MWLALRAAGVCPALDPGMLKPAVPSVWNFSINNETVRVEPFDCARDRLREAQLRGVETPEFRIVWRFDFLAPQGAAILGRSTRRVR